MKKSSFFAMGSIGLLLAASPATVSACDYCMVSQGVSPLDTIKGNGLKLSERYSLLDTIYRGTEKLDNPGAKEEHWSTEATGFFSLSPDFMVLAVVPYKKGSTSGDPDGLGGVDTAGAGDASGLGDISLMGRYTFLRHEDAEGKDTMAGILGLKFPTGRTDSRTADDSDYLDSHLQPGTGSIDYILGLSYSHSFNNRWSLSANLLATLATEGEFGETSHEFGNALNYDLTGRYRLYPASLDSMQPQWFATLGLTGEARGREKEDGVTVDDSGGNTLYLAPGLQLVLASHWTVEFSFQQAIAHDLNGTQLGETYKATGAVTFLF